MKHYPTSRSLAAGPAQANENMRLFTHNSALQPYSVPGRSDLDAPRTLINGFEMVIVNKVPSAVIEVSRPPDSSGSGPSFA